MVMVVPVNTYINKADDIADKDRIKRQQRSDTIVMIARHFYLQHHDGDDNSDNTIAEGL